MLLSLYLDIETVSCRLLQRIARIGMDWNFKKLGQRFQIWGYAGKNGDFIVLWTSAITKWRNKNDLKDSDEHYPHYNSIANQQLFPQHQKCPQKSPKKNIIDSAPCW